MKRFALTVAAAVMAMPVWAVEIGDDGLHKEPFFHDTFKDLREDLDEAKAEGKRLVLFFEQRGCIYCKKMHEEVFSDPDLNAFIDDNFFAVQLNLHGGTEVIDFDGDALSEKDMARKWRVMFTPNIMFMPEEVPENLSASEAAVVVMPGAFGKGTTRDMFTWVLEKRYELEGEEDFQRYHARRISERASGSTQ